MWTEAGGRTSTAARRVPTEAVTQSDYSGIRRLVETTSGPQILLMDAPYLHLMCAPSGFFRCTIQSVDCNETNN